MSLACTECAVEVPAARATPGSDLVCPKCAAVIAPVPIRIGKYLIKGILGRGGMGIVYKASHLDLERSVALKVIDPAALKEPGALDRFQREARAVARLSHPGIVAIHDVDQSDGRMYIVMERVEGTSLQREIARGPILPARAMGIAARLARTVSYAHAHGVIHRDLKPENVILERSGKTKILDFGLAKIERDKGARTLPGAILGTPLYMSPEQAFDGSDAVDVRTDVYSLGVILYEMLCGFPPYGGETVLAILRAMDAGDPRRPSEVNPRINKAIDAVVMKALARDKNNRYASAEDFAAALESLKGGAVKRPPWLWIGGAAAGVSILGMALVWGIRKSPQDIASQETAAVVKPQEKVKTSTSDTEKRETPANEPEAKKEEPKKEEPRKEEPKQPEVKKEESQPDKKLEPVFDPKKEEFRPDLKREDPKPPPKEDPIAREDSEPVSLPEGITGAQLQWVGSRPLLVGFSAKQGDRMICAQWCQWDEKKGALTATGAPLTLVDSKRRSFAFALAADADNIYVLLEVLADQSQDAEHDLRLQRYSADLKLKEDVSVVKSKFQSRGPGPAPKGFLESGGGLALIEKKPIVAIAWPQPPFTTVWAYAPGNLSRSTKYEMDNHPSTPANPAVVKSGRGYWVLRDRFEDAIRLQIINCGADWKFGGYTQAPLSKRGPIRAIRACGAPNGGLIVVVLHAEGPDPQSPVSGVMMILDSTGKVLESRAAPAGISTLGDLTIQGTEAILTYEGSGTRPSAAARWRLK